MRDQICHAIKIGYALRIEYKGTVREIEPHCYGVSAKGKEVLRAYQTAGPSSSGEIQGWKLFDVDEISSIHSLTGSAFSPRPGYKRGDAVCAQRIYCEL
jgi:hypothetical protein